MDSRCASRTPCATSQPRNDLDSSAADTMGDEGKRRVGLVGNHDRLSQRLPPALDTSTIPRKDRCQGLAELDPVTGTCGDHEADGRIDTIIDLRPAAAKRDDTATDRSRLDARDEPPPRRHEQLAFGCLRQYGGIVDDAGIAALCFDDLLQVLGSLPRADRLL